MKLKVGIVLELEIDNENWNFHGRAYVDPPMGQVQESHIQVLAEEALPFILRVKEKVTSNGSKPFPPIKL